jgi:hypothetical protein
MSKMEQIRCFQATEHLRERRFLPDTHRFFWLRGGKAYAIRDLRFRNIDLYISSFRAPRLAVWGSSWRHYPGNKFDYSYLIYFAFAQYLGWSNTDAAQN